MANLQEFKRVNNDTNGNPRYVIHFSALLSRKEYINSMITDGYNLAVEKARQWGGKKYKGKDFGGGIVFQSYNLKELCNQINNKL